MPFQLPLCLRNSFMIVAFLIATICAASTWARDGLAPDVLQRVKAATVLVKVSTEGVQKRGTGFFISKDTVVTNAHVLGISSQNNHTPERIEVILDGDAPNSSAHRASLLDIDVESDLAFLQMSDPRKPEFINIRSSPVAAENLKVFALEYSDGDLPNTEQSSRLIKFSSAVVVQLDNSKQVKRIRFQGSVIPSSDGGPVVDTDGNLIAILTKSIVETRLGLTIAAEVLQSCLRGRIKNVSVTPTLLNGTRYSINISVRTIDPLQNIEAAGFYTWNVPKSAVPPTDLLDGFAKFGDQNGSPRAENKLDLDRMNRRADGVLQRFDLKPAVDLWVQPFVRDTSGERAAEAVNVSVALRKRIETEARLREEEQRIAESARRFPRMPPLPKPKAIPVEERRRDGGYLNQTLSPKISSELESRFAKPATANKVVPVAADLTKDIPAILERDASGQPITVLYSAAEIRKLDSPPILQMAVRSDGSELYVVFERKSTVSIFDPKSMSLIGEISVPRQPVSLWCDQNFLVVACRESHLVAFIDLQTRKLVKSVRIPPGEYDLPVQIVGPAPDGSMITICASSDVQNTLRTLFLIDHTGGSFVSARVRHS